MNVPKLMGAFGAFLLCGVFGVSHASTISLVPQETTLPLGSSLHVDLYMDFSDNPTLGGGVDILYSSSALDFVSFSFDAPFLGITDPLLTCPGAAGCSAIDQLNSVSNIAFGNVSGIGGPYLVGTMVFDTLAAGATTLTSAATAGSAGPFVSASTYDPQAVAYLDATITVSAVPLPGAIWLMLSGIAFLPTLTRRAGKQAA